jgi:hypothetical protein
MNKFNDKLVLIPDSGFRLFFFPLEEAKNILDPEIRDIAKENRNLFGIEDSKEWSDSLVNYDKNTWNVVTSPIPRRYIRYKFGVCHHGLRDYAGLWLAIETNVGDVDRGWQYQVTHTTQADEEHFNSHRHHSVPYHSANSSSLAADVPVSIDILGRNIEVCIRWSSVLTATPLDVDLVIDFGNSRTAVLVLEYKEGTGGGMQFAQHCRPLSLKPSFYSTLSRQTQVDDAIVSSRFVIKTPEFRMFDPDSTKDNALILNKYRTKKIEKTFFDKLLNRDTIQKLDKVEQRVPHMFSKISPVCLGDDMEELIHGQTPLGIEANRRMQGGEQMQQSSAKRYFWDSDLSQQAWSCVPNYGEKVFGEPGRISLLSGLMLRFQPEDGKIWGEDEVLPCDWPIQSRPIINPTSPRYPRRNTLTWSVLAILETAYRQINDSKWTQQAGVFNKRVIRNVIATYPSGWTSTEISQYRAKWLEAIRIFQATNLRSGERAIELDMRIDEAVASQLPLIYASIDRLSSHVAGENWISINGKNMDGEELPKLRVMNVDIGGGTSDISVVEYQDKKLGLDIDLDASVLFKDSSTVAGDLLVKSIISKIILPKMLNNPPTDMPIARKFFANNQNIDVTSKRVSILTGILLPVAIYLLRERCSGRWNEGALKFSLADAGVSSNKGFYDIIYGPGTHVDLKRPMFVDIAEFDQQVEELFGKLIRSLAKYAEIFDVDMLMVCGKPSEQPAIKALIQRMLPIAAERILFTHGFKAGAWYPFKQGEDSEISDAKSVTCVGAALERAMTLKIIPGWKINFKNNSAYRNNWGVMPASGPRFSSDILSASNDVSSELILNNGTRVGRKMFAVNSCFPEPVYRLDIADNIASVKVIFKRLSGDGGQGSESSDALEIVSAVDPETGEDLAGQVTLKLYPVGQDSLHWTDTGKLD